MKDISERFDDVEVAELNEDESGKDLEKKLKKYVKRLSAEKLLESYRFATIVECFGQISEVLREEGYEDASYELMDTANKITDTMILTVLESTEIKKEKK